MWHNVVTNKPSHSYQCQGRLLFWELFLPILFLFYWMVLASLSAQNLLPKRTHCSLPHWTNAHQSLRFAVRGVNTQGTSADTSLALGAKRHVHLRGWENKGYPQGEPAFSQGKEQWEVQRKHEEFGRLLCPDESGKVGRRVDIDTGGIWGSGECLSALLWSNSYMKME